MPKYGDNRPDSVAAKIHLIRMSGITSDHTGYTKMGYWDDICCYQGQETYNKLELLREDITPQVYEKLLAIIKADDADNPITDDL